MLIRTIPAGDLVIENGHFVIARGIDYTRQQLSIRFRFFHREWFLDQREGIPYYRDVFVWNPNLDVIRSLFRRVALRTPGVVALPKFEVLYTSSTRTLQFNFEARCRAGSFVVSPQDRDFVIDVQNAS